jgi:tetratricopeptide (TPR) repeat protein
MDVLKTAEKEIADGNLWRAKEILHRAVGHSGYKIEIYEKLGIVLLQMSDLAEAGKYLFLFGIRKPEYAKAIEIFLHKYKDKPYNLFHPFPRSAKLSKISEYPQAVAEKLRELELPEDLKDASGVYVPAPTAGNDKFALTIFVTIILSITILIILGIVKLFEIIFK